MRCCGTWQGNDHCRRPAPSLAPFGAATRFAPKRQQTLGGLAGCALASSPAQARDYGYSDAHLHYVDFFQESAGMTPLLAAMAAGRIEHVMLSGIPVAKKWHEDEPKRPRYYAGDDASAYWYIYIDLSWTLLRPYLLDKQGSPDPEWVALVSRYPSRFMLGSDVVGRFDRLGEILQGFDPFLDALPEAVAQQVARDNFLAVLPSPSRSRGAL